MKFLTPSRRDGATATHDFNDRESSTADESKDTRAKTQSRQTPNLRFHDDVALEVGASIRSGLKARTSVHAEMAQKRLLGTPVAAYRFSKAIEEEGERLVEAILVHFMQAAPDKAQMEDLASVYRQGLHRYLKAAKDWGRDTSASAGENNDLLDAKRFELAVRLSEQIEENLRNYQASPNKEWRDVYPVSYAILLLFAGAILWNAVLIILQALLPGD